MSFFKLRISFPLNFASPSVSWHIIPLKFSSWTIMLWTKRAHQCTIFLTFECSNEISTNSSCHFWKHKVRVYLNFASSSVSTPLYFFSSNLIVLWTKRAHQRAKFQTFEISNLFFDRLFLLKVYQISTKQVQRSHASWRWRVMQNSKKNWFVVSEITRIWWILTRALKVSTICTLIGSFCAKYIMFDLKSSEDLSWNWRLMQNLKKNWIVVPKMTWGICQIFIRALESLKIGTLMGTFYSK